MQYSSRVEQFVSISTLGKKGLQFGSSSVVSSELKAKPP
jgi:hypothetical protein